MLIICDLAKTKQKPWCSSCSCFVTLLVFDNKAAAAKNRYGISNTNEKKIVYCQKKILILLDFKNIHA